MLTPTILVSLLLAADVNGSTDEADSPRQKATLANRFFNRRSADFRRPERKDEPLREINISDVEVREIETLMMELYPASIVYISPVTTGCPCEDGSTCSDQVWSIATQGGRSYELALSRIDDKWQVGPLQEWWLQRDRILLEMQNWSSRRADQQSPKDRSSTYSEFLERLVLHDEKYPACTTD